ncbi:hypothetical protein WR25_16190 [Diploscapter pachys]|uniref:Protein kinase domain-containing protein n=1 Tax=Diploscapter pachys TaxID=2018661 RepID=A0A2A2L8W3_9BILA|nr:hypothetical protein WR25_16190 [Diploscapter pachys]
MNLMETDLHQIIHSRQKLLEQHFQYFVYQILRGIKALHSAKIAHRDLKPSNLLVNGDCLLRIADFGMARCVESPEPNEEGGKINIKTQYVATRWYRAPELLFSILDYDTQVDMWSIGCILSEMILQRQLLPGKDAPSQVRMIVYYFGTPDKEVLEKVSSPTVLDWIQSCGSKVAVPWQAIFPKATEQAIHLVSTLLQVNPWKRATAEQALEHPYVSQYHDPRFEPICDKQVHFDADAIESLDPKEINAALAEEVAYYESLRGPYNTRTTPPTIEDLNDEEKSESAEKPRMDASDRRIDNDTFSQIREEKSSSSSCSTTQCSPCSSTSTVRRMDEPSKRNSRLMEYSSTEALNLTSDRFETGEDQSNSSKGRTQNGLHHHQHNGIIVPLDDASTSSAPADFQRPNYRQSIKASLERKQRENRNRNALEKMLRRGTGSKKEKARTTYADSLLQAEEDEAWRKAAKARSRTCLCSKRNSADATATNGNPNSDTNQETATQPPADKKGLL